MTKSIAAALAFTLLLACSACTTPSNLEGDSEAEKIYNDLAAAGFLPDEPPRANGTGLSPTWSRVWHALRELAGTEDPQERQAAREGVSIALTTTGYVSQVCFRTPTPGAKVFVQSISSRRSIPIGYTNKRQLSILTLGLYNIWTVRDGKRTDIRENQPITVRQIRIDLEGDSSRQADCDG